MAGQKVLVIEDEGDILEIIAYNLGREGYQVLSSRDGEEGLEIAQREEPDLILLDLMLPGTDGLEICRIIKDGPRGADTPIIMVTAKGEESDVVLGLGMGADDYVVKPFSPRELVARVKAVLRRGPLRVKPESGERVERDGVVIDAQKFMVKVDGDSVPFTATEFRLLHYLARHPGRVFSRNQLLARVIGDDAVVIDRNIDVHVRSLRKKLGPYRDLIETQRGVGYRFKDVE
ncbi:MAG: response regulator [Candidatus Krumholzibacteriia bacterium]|nr:response regulator [bacterium]MCB9516505.1 response regulator [Candidatus Latescibacterota bacterium]